MRNEPQFNLLPNNLQRSLATHMFQPFPASPLPLIPVPPRAKERLREALATIRFNHIVAAIVNGMSVHYLQKDVRYLTGEDPASTLATRHSFSEDAPRAAAWLKAQFEALGAECDLKHFAEGYAPNVIWLVLMISEVEGSF